ncbi:glycine cleavage system protein H [Blattabacterium cuenoti]|uniref:glycine cleavage system protein H n=1 Tax=Blattabacterium cuenoti TaxID=1653831 RepID=UPI00163C42E5|nr:glycine cleavage system protein H [Blattabacterium cuenoti]
MYPDILKYSKNHEWVGIIKPTKENGIKKDDNHAYVGISFFAQKELGDIIYLDIENSIVDRIIKKGEIFGTIEAVKTISDLFMPVLGKVLEINEKSVSHPEFINEDSCKIWIIKIKILCIEDYNKLMTLKEYETFSKSL